MSYNKKQKIRYFSRISTREAEKIAYSWMSSKLNPVEGKNIWQSQGQSIKMQQNDQYEIQIMLQEMIDMIDNDS